MGRAGLAAVGDLCTDENQASDLVRRLPFCEPIPPLTDRRNPQIRAAAHQNSAPRAMQLCNVSFRQPARAMRPDLPRSAEGAVKLNSRNSAEAEHTQRLVRIWRKLTCGRCPVVRV
jgi:hypothetical protein